MEKRLFPATREFGRDWLPEGTPVAVAVAMGKVDPDDAETPARTGRDSRLSDVEASR